MKTYLFFSLLVMGPWLALPVAAAVVPKITGTPVIDAPPSSIGPSIREF
jgi:hypothetical protein